MGFLDNYSMKAMREQVDDKLMVIKLFAANYARDLMSIIIFFSMNVIDHPK